MMLLEVGILFDRGNYTEFTDKILRLPHERELSKSQAKLVRNELKKLFSWKDKIDQYLRLYKITCHLKFE